MEKMEVVEMPIEKLIPAEYNPRYLSEKAYSDLKASLQRFDAVEPIIVNMHPKRKNIIIGGHQRVKVAKDLGWEKFPAVQVNLSRDEERELNIRLNKNTGTWDWDELSTYFNPDELEEWGFSEEELFADENPEPEIDDISDEVHAEYRVEVLCESEQEQETVYNQIKEMGYECRVLTL